MLRSSGATRTGGRRPLSVAAVEWFVPPDTDAMSERGVRIRALVWTHLIVVAVGTTALASSVMAGAEPHLGRPLVAGGLLLMFANLAAIRRGRGMRPIAWLTVLELLAICFGVATVTGALRSPALAGLVLVPVAAGYFLGYRGIRVTVLVSLTGCLALFGLESLGALPAPAYSSQAVLLGLTAALLGAVAVLTTTTRTLRDLATFSLEDEVERHRATSTELAEARDLAEQATRTREAILRTLSHELRTPLNAIIGFAQLMEDGARCEDDRRNAFTIRDAAAGLITVLDDVFLYTELTDARLELRVAPTDLERVVTSTARMFKFEAQQRGIELITESEVPEGVRVMVDSHRVRHVLFRLLSNAMKFTARGQVVLRVDAHREGGALHARFEVVDTGIGMTRSTLAKVFDGFVQGDGSSARAYSGVGLGLSISSRLVQLMGGTLDARSAPGKGSRFFFTLELPMVADRQQFAAGRHFDALQVLVAEDNQVNQELLKRVLEKLGHSVGVVANGVEAVRSVATSTWDVVVMDLNMPVMDGVEATRRIRKAGYDVPIIALTASTLGEDAQRSRDAGMDAFLSKPLNPDRLREAIRAAAFPTATPPS